MPRPSANPDKARTGGGGVEAGNYLVNAAKFQNLKTDYKVCQPTLVLSCDTLDKDGDPVRGADPVEMYFSFGSKSLEAFHPGQCSGPDDDQPEDLGDAVDVEGNTIYCAGDEQFNSSCGAIVFNTSLVKAGFPKEILDRCYAPDYVGLKFSLNTRTSKELNEKMGTRLSTKPTSDGGTVTYKVAEKWLNPNYLTSSNGAGKSKGKAAAEPEEAKKPKPTDPEEIAREVLVIVSKEKAGPKNTVKTKQALVGFFTNAYTKGKYDPKLLKKCQDFVKDDDWALTEIATLGGSYEDGVAEFPA